MSGRKYRLAAPIDNDESKSLVRSPRSMMLHNLETNTSKAFLDDQQKIEESTPFIPPARWWLVLPCIVLILFVSAADNLLLNDLIIRRYQRYYGFNASPDTQRDNCRQSTTTSIPMYYWQFYPPYQPPPQGRPDYSLVQRDAASFQIKNSIVGVIPSLVIFILLGSNCDTIGRRPLLVLPFVGKVIWYSLMLIIVSRNLSDAWLLAANGIEGIFGSIGLVMLSGFAYITDCTCRSMRTRAFLLTEGLLFLTRIVPILALGIWLRFYLYTVPLGVCLGVSVIGLFYALFVQPESVENVRNVSLVRQLARIRLKPIVRIITVFTVKRAGDQRKQLAFITIVLIFLRIVFFGSLSVFSLYLYGRPLCLDALHVSLISTAQAVLTFLLSTGTALSKKSLDKTYLAAVFGALSVIINLIIVGLARRIWLLYIAAGIGSLSFITLPVLRTKLIRQIEMNEYAIVFIGAGIIETISISLVGAAANSIYRASINFFSGLIFMIFASVGLIPIVLMCYLAYLERRAAKNSDTTMVEDSNAQV